MSDCPKNWLALPLSEVVHIQKGRKPVGLGEKSDVRTVPYVNIAAFETKIIAEYAPEQDIPRCEIDDTLLVWDGARAGLAGTGVSGYVGSTLAKLTSDLVLPSYLFHFISSKYGVLNTQTKGVGIPHVNPTILNSLEFSLPPVAEQLRIVAKLEELLADLDAGVAELKAAQKKLGQYRQSLLKAAVEGRLTESWRGAQPPIPSPSPARGEGSKRESGAELLARILVERRRRWEEKQLAKFKEQGKAPPKDWQKKYPEPVKPDTSGLPELPEGWGWASIEQLGYVQLGRQRSPSKMKGESPVKYMRAANITEAGINFDDVLEMDFSANEQKTFQLKKGDVLLTEASGSPEHVGRPVVWPEVEGLYCFQNTVIRFRPIFTDSHFSFRLFQAWQKLGKFIQVAGGVGINHLSAGKFASIVVPLPPLQEQQAIVELLDSSLNEVQAQERNIAFSLKQAAAQRKNILKAAFAGQLVPQDPDDEPASVLLARIRAGREQQKDAKTMKTTRKNKKVAHASP